MHKRTLPFLTFSLIMMIAVFVGAAGAGDEGPRTIAPTTLTMDFPAAFGEMQRPAVEFNHGAHTKALEEKGCETCHRIDDKLVLIPTMKSILAADNRDQAIDGYHDACVNCHRDRAANSQTAGPVTCGECHVRRLPGISARVSMDFDYSLHARHVKASEDRCENCHHVYDEVAEELKHEKGKEEACRACHGAEDEDRKLSLANASHRQCVSCHYELTESGFEAGPVLCAGCHDQEQRDAIQVLAEVPRLLRGQADTIWVTSEESKSPSVAFNHLAHEGQTTFCTDCHHRTLQACDDCHTLTGSVEGAGVTVAQSYHLKTSQHSCVGCHTTVAVEHPQCSGCHSVPTAVPADRACAICHSGPVAHSAAIEKPPLAEDPLLGLLPSFSDDYPETVVIDFLVDRYEASTLPHAKIVSALETGTRESKLAAAFHEETKTLCSGCHHHTPIGVRPPPCRSCHGEKADATRDRPGLKVAYHRQCVGCHVQMGVAKQGCTDCHAAKEDQS